MCINCYYFLFNFTFFLISITLSLLSNFYIVFKLLSIFYIFILYTSYIYISILYIVLFLITFLFFFYNYCKHFLHYFEVKYLCVILFPLSSF